MRTAAIPHWWLVAVSRYSRLTRAELSALLTVATHTWDMVAPSPLVTISYPTLQKRIGAATAVGTVRSMMALATPARVPYRWGERSRLGHGMLIRHRAPCRSSANRYELQLDIADWGWEPHERAAAIDLATTARESSLLHRRYPAIVLVIGEMLRRHVDEPPLPHDDDKHWTRWCDTIHRLLGRGYTTGDLVDAIEGAVGDSFWARRIRRASTHADVVLIDEFEGFLLRGRYAATQEEDVRSG